MINNYLFGGAHFWWSWGHLGAILGHLAAILGPFWGHLGPSWVILEPSWDHLGVILGHLGPSGAILGSSWGHLVGQRSKYKNVEFPLEKCVKVEKQVIWHYILRRDLQTMMNFHWKKVCKS